MHPNEERQTAPRHTAPRPVAGDPEASSSRAPSTLRRARGAWPKATSSREKSDMFRLDLSYRFGECERKLCLQFCCQKPFMGSVRRGECIRVGGRVFFLSIQKLGDINPKIRERAGPKTLLERIMDCGKPSKLGAMPST